MARLSRARLEKLDVGDDASLELHLRMLDRIARVTPGDPEYDPATPAGALEAVLAEWATIPCDPELEETLRSLDEDPGVPQGRLRRRRGAPRR